MARMTRVLSTVVVSVRQAFLVGSVSAAPELRTQTISWPRDCAHYPHPFFPTPRELLVPLQSQLSDVTAPPKPFLITPWWDLSPASHY